jgi:choline dehydrogenase-like flavoprotein
VAGHLADRGAGVTEALDAEVLVVGSGAGGAPTAAILAEAGFDVLVLEEGPLVRQGEVTPFSLEQMDRQYRAGGITVALGRPSIAYTEGCCAGGGTEINSGLYRRPPEEVVDRWRTRYRVADLDPVDLFSICDEVERELSVQTVPGSHTPASEALRRGAAALGWRHDEIPRWMDYTSGPDARHGRRRSMTETYLPRAESAGAHLLTGHRVHRLVLDGDRATRAEITTADGRPTTVDFAHVVVCGGAIQTPALLQRSGLRHRVGRTLAVHPTVKLAARFPDAVNVPDDVPVHQVKEFAPDLSFGGSASGAGLVALALSDSWLRFRDAVADWRNLAVYYAAITSEGRGRVQALPRMRDPLVTYRLTRGDRALLGRGLARLALAMLEAGATEVYPSYRGAPIVRRRADLATMQATFAASRASVMTVHLCSTVPFGEHDHSPADSVGLVRGTRNVYVNDASLLPDAPGVNPQASVMAIAVRNARRFAENTKRAG